MRCLNATLRAGVTGDRNTRVTFKVLFVMLINSPAALKSHVLWRLGQSCDLGGDCWRNLCVVNGRAPNDRDCFPHEPA